MVDPIICSKTVSGGVDSAALCYQLTAQAGRRLVRSLLTLRVFVVDVMDLRTGNRNEDDS